LLLPAEAGDEDCQAIDIFGGPRRDYMMKMMQVMAALNVKK
jgi:hypothetical protein